MAAFLNAEEKSLEDANLSMKQGKRRELTAALTASASILDARCQDDLTRRQ